MIEELKFELKQLQPNTSESDFLALAKRVFEFQKSHNPIYRSYLEHIGFGHQEIEKLSDFPFLPISFFKTQRVSVFPANQAPELIFRSSGTTKASTSEHLIYDKSIYEWSFEAGFELFFPHHRNTVIIAVLPSYVERSDYSLVYMVQGLLSHNQRKESGFFSLQDPQLIPLLEDPALPKILIGVSFALIDLASRKIKGKNLKVIETGGMKGKRKELIRSELHEILKKGLKVDEIHSEYGMTELLSQAYFVNDQFAPAPSLKILSRDLTDPLTTRRTGRGGLNAIDLSNLESCSFVATEDQGQVNEDGTFTVDGRIDHAQIRGCNLLYSPT